MIHIQVWLFWLLLCGFMTFGMMVAGLLRAGLITRLEQDKRDLARQLALACGHPSSRPAGRVLRVVGSDGAMSRPGRW